MPQVKRAVALRLRGMNPKGRGNQILASILKKCKGYVGSGVSGFNSWRELANPRLITTFGPEVYR